MKNVVLYGGSFNPPCVHHADIVRTIAEDPSFQTIVVIPSGQRADKNYVDHDSRMSMVIYAFGGMPNVTLDLRNLKGDAFTSNFHLESVYRQPDVRLWHAIGSDLLIRSNEGINPIQQRWTEGRFIWDCFSFLIIPRTDYPITHGYLPKRHYVLRREFRGSSTEVRTIIQKGGAFKHLVDYQTYDLIVSRKLYQ